MATIPLSSLCSSIDYGYTASARENGGGPRFLRITDIVRGTPEWETVPYCEADERTTARFKLHHGDIVVARTGATTGASAYITDPPLSVFASYLVRLKIDDSVADPRFVSYYLKGPQFWEYIRGVLGDKSAQPNASARTITQAPVSLLSLDDQRAIAGVLGALDDKIEQNRRTARALERLARAIFRAWFVDFEPVKAKAAGAASFPSMPQAAFDALPTRLVDSAIGPVPEGWEVGTLGDVARHVRDGVKPSEIDPATPYIGLEHMPRRSITLAEWEHAGKVTSGKSRFIAGQILFGKLRPYFHKVGVAPIDGVCSTDIVVVEPKAADWFGLVLGYASSDDFVAHTTACSTGTKMPRTNWGDMAGYPIALPPVGLAGAFTEAVAPMVELLQESVFESQRLAELRDLLLPKLLSGEVRMMANGVGL